MVLQTNPYLIWLLLPGLLTFGLALYILSRPLRRRESNSLAAFLLGGTVWSLGNAIQLTSPDLAWQSFWNSFTYIGVLTVPTAWLFLVTRFTGYFRAQVKKYRSILLAVPALTFLIILTNPSHQWFFASLTPVQLEGFVALEVVWGPAFYMHMVYSYILIFGGMGLLVYGLIRNFTKYGIHTYGLIVGVLTPLIGNAVYLFGVFPPSFPDPTPITFMVTGVTFAWAIVGSKLFETVPLAHSSIVENLSTGILVLDPENMVLDINRAACSMLQVNATRVLGEGIELLFPSPHPFGDAVLPAIASVENEAQAFRFNSTDEDRTYAVRVEPVLDHYGELSGCLIQIEDVTQIRQVEENLATTQETFTSVLDTLQDSFYEADPRGVVLNANLAFVRALGYQRKEDVLGKHFRNFTDRQQVREIFKKFEQLYETRQALEPFLYDYRTRDGSIYHGETVVVPIMDGDEIVGVRGMVRNVTDRVRAEREVAEQKEFLDGLLQNAPFAIAITNLENQVTVINPAFEHLFGYELSEIAGRNLSDLLVPADLADENRSVSQRMRTEKVYLSTRRLKKNSEIVDVEIFSSPYYLRNEIFGTLVFYNDISERLKAEAELDRTESNYRAILDTLTDAYVEADPSGRIIYGNQAFVDAVGQTSKEDVIGMHFRRVIPRGTVRSFVQHYQEVYETRKSVDPFEVTYLNQGRELIAEWVIAPILEEGEVVGTRGIARDVSERIEAQRTLREAKEAAENRARELFAINRVAEQVSESLDLNEILQTVCRELTKIFNVRNAGIGLLDPSETFLEIHAFHSVDPKETTALGMKLPLEGNAASQEVIRLKKTIVIEDAQSDPQTSSIQDLSRVRGTKRIMIVPLLARGKVIGTIGMPAKDSDHNFTQEEITLAGTIASQIASAVDNAQLYAQTETALGAAKSDLEIGSQIQSGFFPEELPTIPGWEVATHFHSARQVAGDFYDVFKFENSRHTAFVIADVCDKGVGAALFMVLFRSLMRAFSNFNIDSDRVAEQLQEIILKTNNYVAEIHGTSSMFATVFFGILDPDTNRLYYANGGHEPPAILDKDGNIKARLMPTGPAVGLFPDLPFDVEEIYLEPGDILVGFTDGTTDARNIEGELFSEERLLACVASPWTSIFSMIYELQIALRNHIAEQAQFDDITLISFRRKLSEEPDYHAICRPAEMDVFGEMREFVEQAAEHNGLVHEDVFAFKLAAEEILTNVIQYGYEGRSPGLIAIAFESDKEKSTLKIWDDGTYFSPDEAETPDLELGWEERKIGGLGIFFVQELMDRVEYTRESNQINLLLLEKKHTGKP